MLIEAAVDSVADALAVEQAGVSRIELCANLDAGGTTPSAGLIKATLARLGIPVFVMIRPRAGDFLYGADEIEVMLRDIEVAKHAGAHGIVSGALHANGVIDEEGTEALLEAAAPLPFTFHKAFDATRDLTESLDALVGLGVTRVLTSGGASTAMAGHAALRRLVGRAGSRLTLIAGGGVRADHAVDLVRESGVRELHLGPRRTVASPARRMPGWTSASDWSATDVESIAAMVRTLAIPTT